MKKSVMTIAVATTVGLGTILGVTPLDIKAESISSLKGEQNKIQEKKSDLNSTINQANDKITSLQDQKADVQSEMKRLDIVIGDTITKISEKNAKIDDTKAQIVKLQEETKVIKDRIAKRNILLKDRARSYQETGGLVNYLDVLMGASSFSDFIDRANAVATIMQADQDILKQHEADKKKLEETQNQVENDLASLEKMRADLEKMNQQLAGQKAEKNKLLDKIIGQEEEAQEYVMDLQEEQQILASQEVAIQKAIKQEQERQAAAAKAAAEAAKGNNNNSSSGSGQSTTPPASNGSFTRPTVGPVTSGYGYRSYDNEFHNGIDFGRVTNSDAIVAVADGVVSRSYLSSSYGECIMIASFVNGQLYTSVYAHMKSGSRTVHDGDSVKKGQVIGIKGETGQADGIHLHFELHKGEWNVGKTNKINPVGIIPGI